MPVPQATEEYHCLVHSATHSPIIMVVQLVFERIQLGMIEASATCLDLVTRMDGSAPTAPTMTDGGARAPTSGYD